MTADKNASKTRERVVFPTMTNGRTDAVGWGIYHEGKVVKYIRFVLNVVRCTYNPPSLV